MAAELAISNVAASGLRLMRDHPVAVLGWVVLYIVFTVIMFGALLGLAGPAYLRVVARATQTAAPLTPAEGLALFRQIGGAMLIFMPIGLLGSAAMYAAIYRAVLRPEEGAFFYLRMGGDELRLLAVSVLLILLLSLAWAVGVIAVVAAAAAVRGAFGVLLAVFGGIALFCFMVFLCVKLSLAAPMTFARKRIILFDSWRLTGGHFWALFWSYVLAGVFMVVGAGVGQVVLGAIVGDTLTPAIGPLQAAMQSGVWSGAMGSLWLAAIAFLIITPILSVFQLVVIATPGAAAYAALTGDADRTAETFA